MRDYALKGSGTTKGLSRVEIVNLIGVTLAIFGFIFGPWLGSRSGLWVLADLARFLMGADRPADIGRQQGIFILLVALALILIGLAVALYADMRTSKRHRSITEFLLAAAALVLLGKLFFSYDARTAGVMLTALGCMIAGGGALAINHRGLREGYPERGKALPRLEQLWAGMVADASASNKPLSILALSTSEPMHFEVVDLVDAQLRARDIEFPTREGLFVLLWETDTGGAVTAAHHLQDILAEQGHGYSWIGVASYPEDGDQMRTLLERAQQAHDLARAFSDQSMVVPFSYPERSEALPSIERAWEATMAEARASSTPLALLAMATSQAPNAADIALVEEELRSQDLVFPVRDGLFALLWKVALEDALRVANHIQEILASHKHIQSHVGVVCFPEDGDQIDVLIERHREVAFSTYA
jgi:hypothetical protein